MCLYVTAGAGSILAPRSCEGCRDAERRPEKCFIINKNTQAVSVGAAAERQRRSSGYIGQSIRLNIKNSVAVYYL